jgi:hypothetical protein
MTAHEAVLARLRAQAEGLGAILAAVGAAALQRRPATDRWSAHDNIAHLARHQDVFLSRVRRILAEDAPRLSRYRAEDDADWPAWAALATAEVLERWHAGRRELIRLLQGLSPAQWERTGVHAALGEMPLHLWMEFFLAHEGHHLYTIFLRSRGS